MSLDPKTLRLAATSPEAREEIERLLVNIRKEAARAEALATECDRQAEEARRDAAFNRDREAQIVAALSEIAL